MTDPTTGLLDAHAAARVYGCASGHLNRLMRTYGFTPAYIATTPHGLRKYYWRGEDVLAARKQRAIRRHETAQKNIAVANGRKRQMFRLLARHASLERYRQRVLARIAARTAGC